MGSVIVAAVMGWALERTNILVNFLIAPSLRNENAGFGAVEGTIKRETLAPACYRVFVPWLIFLYSKIRPGDNKSVVYQGIRTLLMMFMFWSMIEGWGLQVAAVAGVIMVSTIRFDYWDWPVEVAGVSLAMTGNFPLAMVGAVISALSRETAPLMIVVYFCKTMDWMGSLWLTMAVAGIMLFVRLYVGSRALHCKRFILELNLNALLNIFKWRPVWNSDLFITVALTIFGILAMLQFPPGWMIIPIILILSWTLAKYDEARTMTSIIPYIAAYLIGGM